MPYGDNPLLAEIRKERGTGTSQGVAEPPTALQDEFRPTVSTDRESGGNTQDGSGGSGRSNGTNKRDVRVDERNSGGKRRTNSKIDESHGGANGSRGSSNSALPATELAQKIAALYKKNPAITVREAANLAGCSTGTANTYLKPLRGTTHEKPADTIEEKPAGLAAKPHEKESAIRQQQAEEQARANGEKAEPVSVKGIYSFFSRKKGDKSDSKDSIRNKPFSEREAEEIKGPLLSALMDYFKYTDELIYATHKKHAHVQIWSTIDDEEAEVLVDAWLGMGKRSARAAGHIVHAVNMHAQLRVGIILLPRFYQTFQVYMESGFGVK